MRHRMLQAVWFGLVLLGTASDVAAGSAIPAPVPEISPTSLSAGLAILAGGVLMLRARRRK